MFMQNGLTKKWKSDTKAIFKLEAALKLQHLKRIGKKKTNMGHLQPAFILLICGIFCSGIIFIFEKITFRKFMNEKRK